MPVFYLEPRNGDTSHPRWQATTLQEGAFVNAENAASAREVLQRKTLKATLLTREMVLIPPWIDVDLVDCELVSDPPFDVPKDTILGVTGRNIG